MLIIPLKPRILSTKNELECVSCSKFVISVVFSRIYIGNFKYFGLDRCYTVTFKDFLVFRKFTFIFTFLNIFDTLSKLYCEIQDSDLIAKN